MTSDPMSYDTNVGIIVFSTLQYTTPLLRILCTRFRRLRVRFDRTEAIYHVLAASEAVIAFRSADAARRPERLRRSLF